MNRKRFRVPSPAMVIALVALLVGLGGGAYAAKIKLGKNAVKTKNIKDSAITDVKLAPNAVTEGKLAPGAVTEAKLAPAARGQAVAWAEVNANGTIAKARGLSAANISKPGGAAGVIFCLVNLPEHGTATVSPVFAGDAHEFGFPGVSIDQAPIAGGSGCTGVGGLNAVVATWFSGIGTTASSYNAQSFILTLVK